MPKQNKSFFSILAVLLLVAGGAVGVYLVQQPQDIRQQAAVPTGVASISLSPPEKTDLTVGQYFDVDIMIDTNNTAISNLTAKLSFATVGISITDMQPNQDLINLDRLRYDIFSQNTVDGVTTVSMSVTATTPAGYISPGPIRLATLTLGIEGEDTIQPTFDPVYTTMHAQDTGNDILALPASPAGIYGTSPILPSPTPTPSPTPIPTPTPTTSLGMQFRLQGINSSALPQELTLTVKPDGPVILATEGDGGTTITTATTNASNDPQGIYSASFSNLPIGTYKVCLKGKSHLQKCWSGVTLTANNNTLDKSAGFLDELRAGDVTGEGNNNNVQDNLITSDDLAYINSGCTQFTCSAPAADPRDVNNDGFFNIKDLALGILNFRYFVIPGDE